VSSTSEQRAGRTEALFREVNENIAGLEESFSATDEQVYAASSFSLATRTPISSASSNATASIWSSKRQAKLARSPSSSCLSSWSGAYKRLPRPLRCVAILRPDLPERDDQCSGMTPDG
jgi:hypothetical protein